MSDVSVFMILRAFATRYPEHDVFASGAGKGDRQHVLVSAVLSNVSGCEQTVKSTADRVCDVPLRMLQVPRPEFNRCTTRECSA
jgi:hypothetical protein